MKRILSKFLLLLAVPLLKMSHLLSDKRKKKNTPQHQRVQAWYNANGDNTLRIQYLLDSNSVVFDIGGYEGNWAAEIFCKYGCGVYIFEPVQEYYNQIHQRFSNNDKVRTFPFGLGGKDSTLEIGILDDASSTFKTNSGPSTKIDIKCISTFILQNEIGNIDLMKINIEGGEYELMESLIENNLVKHVSNFQIQFHDFVPDAESRMKKIQETLSKTHELTYQFEFVWENWKKIN